jgi:thymidine phosphorylase
MKSVYELIAAKRDRDELSEDEITFLVNGFTKGDIEDYQMSSFLMAPLSKAFCGDGSSTRSCCTLAKCQSAGRPSAA